MEAASGLLNPPNPLFKGAIGAACTPSAQGRRFVVLRAASDDAWLIPQALLGRAWSGEMRYCSAAQCRIVL